MFTHYVKDEDLPLHPHKVFEIKDHERLLFGDEPGQGFLAALPRAEQCGDWVYAKRFFDLTDGVGPRNHA